MQYFLDLSLIALVLVTVIVFWRRGLLRSLMGAAKTVLAVILTYLFGDAASDWLYRTYLQPSVRTFVHTRLEEHFASVATSYDLSSLLAAMPEWLQNLLALFDVDSTSLEQKFGSVKQGSLLELEELVNGIADPVVSFISTVIGYAAVFLTASVLLAVLAFILGKLADLPLIRGCDRALGLLLGILCAALYASVYVLLVYLLLGWWEVSHPEIAFRAAFDHTWIFRHAYHYNFFRLLFGI